jgi:beta-fructofuranosidase
VLIVSPLLHSIPSLRGPVQYAVGRFDGRRFEHGPWHPLDLGGPAVFYAPNSLHDDRGRRIQWGWLMGGGAPEAPWNGLLTLPRQLTLGDDLRLRVWPVAEVDTLRGASIADLGPRELAPGAALDVCQGTQLDVVIDLKPQGPGRLVVELFRSAAGDHATTISFDVATGELRCGDKSGIVPPGAGECRTMRLLVDRSVIEVYADHREVMSLRVFPPTGADGLKLSSQKSPVRLTRVRAWRMNSIW